MQTTFEARDESGQTMAEYAVVLAVITPFIGAAFALLSDSFIERLQTVTDFLS